MIETKKLGNYTLEILPVEEFKDYYYDNLGNFSTVSHNSFLKALDIPPKFFKEQPEETQKELLDNREIFVRETKKFFDKVIVVLRGTDDSILNACRLGRVEADEAYESLKSIEEVRNKFEHRSFVKDGYISFIVGEVNPKVNNQVLAIDFPILLNKKPVIHEAFYTLPDESFAVPVEHIQYYTSEEIELGLDYKNIKEAVEAKISFLTEDVKADDDLPILRDPDVVALALVEHGTIPKSYQIKVSKHIEENSEIGLTTDKLESLVLDFDEDVRSYKQVTSLREVSGSAILTLLESETFKELAKELDSINDNEPELIKL